MEKLSKILKETLIFRLIIAIGLIVMSLLPLFSEFLKIVMLSFSVLIAGFSSIYGIYVSLKKREFYNFNNIIIYFCIIILFIIGYSIEGAIICIIFEVSLLLINHALEIVRTKSIDYIDRESLDIKSFVYEIFDMPDSDVLLMENQMTKTISPVLFIGIFLAIVYAIFMPVIFHLSYTASIHRALAIIIICTPISLISSYRAIGSYMLCQAASDGILFNKVSALEAISDCKYVILDDNLQKGVDKTNIIYSHSSSINNDTLLNFVYHVVYMSNQGFSNTIKRSLNINYQPGIVFDTTDIPGYGIKATINDTMVLFGNEQLCNRFGIDVSSEYSPNIRGDEYYLCLANKCVGVVVLSDYTDANIDEIESIFDNYGIRSALFSEKDALRTTKKPILSIFYPENMLLARKDINLSISEDPFSNDGCIIPDHIDNIPTIPYLSRGITNRAFTNTVIAFGIKILLIILSVTGFLVPWVTILIDTIITLALIMLVHIMPEIKLLKSFNRSK